MEVLLFLARRLAAAAVLLVALTFITFVVFFKVPSEPAAFLVDPKTATQAQIKAARHVLGADRPVHVQFAKYVWRLAHADFGRSWRTYYVTGNGVVLGSSVSRILRDAAGVTASLVLGGAALLLLLSIPLGAWSASRPRSLLDRPSPPARSSGSRRIRLSSPCCSSSSSASAGTSRPRAATARSTGTPSSTFPGKSRAAASSTGTPTSSCRGSRLRSSSSPSTSGSSAYG